MQIGGVSAYTIFAVLTYPLDENDVERYLQRESDLRRAILGTDRSNYLEWEVGKSLPILREPEALQSQLATTEVAKANAEELAFGRLDALNMLRDDIDSITQELLMTQDILNKNNRNLEKIIRSKSFKLLSVLRLAPEMDVNNE